MGYREPGVRVEQLKNTSLGGSVASNLPMCLVGSGLSVIEKTYKVIKSSDLYDPIVDEDGDYVSFSSIVKVGDTKESEDYNIGSHTSDYSLSSQVIDGATVAVVLWAGGVDDRTPSTGSTFYATVNMVPADKHYELKVFSSKLAVIGEYGEDVVNGTINNISLAAQIALENVSSVYVRKAKKAGATITLAELSTALEDIKTDESIYRIIPVDGPKADLNNAVVGHVNLMSDPEEGLERDTVVAVEHSSTTFEDVVTNVGGYATSVNNYRVATIYPDKAQRQLSDGTVYTLGGQFVAVALAALKSSMPPEESYTGKSLTNFLTLKGEKMTKAQKNILAEKGVMILEQEKSGYPIGIRHGLSTDMSNLQSREVSVTELADFVARTVRGGLKQYKGKLITKSLMAQISAATSSMLGTLTRQGHILDGSQLTSIEQDPENPDHIYISIRILVPYPCNYIDVVIAYD